MKLNQNTNFKGVIQKMLISSLVLTSVLGSTAGAFAAETPIHERSHTLSIIGFSFYR